MSMPRAIVQTPYAFFGLVGLCMVAAALLLGW